MMTAGLQLHCACHCDIANDNVSSHIPEPPVPLMHPHQTQLFVFWLEEKSIC